MRTWIEGCQAAGALACAKHFPGHGRTAVDSHIALPVVADTAATLRESDLLPFAIAVESGVASIMTAHVAYPALDPTGVPATLSRPIMDELRGPLRFDGLVVSDALIMDGALAGRRESDAAVEAVRAGVDLLLYPNDARRVRDALEQALASGALSAPASRSRSPATSARSPPPPRPTPPVTPRPLRVRRRAGGRAAGAGHAPWGGAQLHGPLDLVVVDDDLGGPYPPGPPIGPGRCLAPSTSAATGRLARGARVCRAAGMEGALGVRVRGLATRWPTPFPTPISSCCSDTLDCCPSCRATRRSCWPGIGSD